MGNRLTKNKKQSSSPAKRPPPTNGQIQAVERTKKALPDLNVNGLTAPATPPRTGIHAPVSAASTPRSSPSTPAVKLRVQAKKDGPPITPDISQSRITLIPKNSELQTAAIPVKSILVAAYDYDSRQTDELSFKKGDKMEVTGDSENCDWCLVKHKKSGKTGFIPRNYVVLEKHSVRIQDWFCPLDRGDAERTLLNPELGRGTFLVRERPDGVYPYAVSVKDYSSSKSEYAVRHYKVRTAGKGGYYISHEYVFSSMLELVRFYSENSSSGLCCQLRTPCPKTKPFVPFREMEICKTKITFIRKMGDGYFGEVWKGKMRNNEDVAIKMMKEGKMSALSFIKEAKVLHNLRHPKLVPLRGVCTKTKPMMIITELMPKGDLLNYIRSDIGKRLKIPHLVDMSSQIANGMSYLEKCNYIHRDLRAANVLVGENNIVKIADFGLARLVLNDDDVYIMTNQSKVPIKWTAPEALFKREFSTKSDVWSFAVLLYEIFTYGKNPYPGISSASLASMLHTGYRMPKPKSFPDEVYSIMMQCWEDLPENRPEFAYLHTVFDDYIVSTENSYRERDL